MTHLFMFLLSMAGFSALALATERQQEELLGDALSPKATRVFSIAGWIALLVALVVAVDRWGWAFGFVAYSGHTSLAAGLVYIGLAVSQRTLAKHSQRSVERRRI